MRPGSALVAVFLLSTAVLVQAGDWSTGSGSKQDQQTPCNCGQIQGTIGRLTAFTQTYDAGSGYYVSTGSVGAKWNGEQYDSCSNSRTQILNSVTHGHTRTTQGAATNPILTVITDSTLTFGGSAERLRSADPEWWWDADATVVESPPEVRVLNNGQWQVLQLPVGATTCAGSARDATGNNQPPDQGHQNPWSGMSWFDDPNESDDTPRVEEGASMNSFDLSGANMTGVSIQWVFRSEGGPVSADNAKVGGEQLKLEFTLLTKFTGS